MKKYEIQITETLQRIVVVKAKDLLTALGVVEDGYIKEETVLDADDFVSVEYEEVT